MLSVFGSTGFIGSVYYRMFANESVIIPRSQTFSETNDILYFISTNNNYNVFDNPHLDIDTNLNLLIDVLESCKNKDNITFNFISSWFVYGKTKDLPAHEQSPCNPKGFYSITKRTAEQLIISYCETFGIKYRILRLSNIYGEEDKQTSKKRNALQFLTGEIVHNRDINLYDRGENIRDFLHVTDACKAINHVVNDKSTKNDIINIGSGIPTKFIDVANYVKDISGSTSNFNFIEPPTFHKIVQVQDMFLDVRKLTLLGFTHDIDIWSGLNTLINFYKKKR